MSAVSTRIFLFNWHFLCIKPTLFVFLLTHLSKSSTNTELGLHFCLFLPGIFKTYSGLLASLPAFSPNLKISLCTWLPCNSIFCPASLSHVSITFATTSMPLGCIVLYCGNDNVFYTLHKYRSNTNTPKYTLTHTVNTSNTAQFTMFRSSKCYTNIQMF